MKKPRTLNRLMVFSGLFFLCFSQNILIFDTFAASGVITTFSDGSSSQTLLIPPGSSDSSIAVQIPQDVIIVEAKVDITGGTSLNFLDIWNFENSCRFDDAVCTVAHPGWPRWDMVPDPAGVLGQVLHMSRASAPLNRRAVTIWSFPDDITIEFWARGSAGGGDVADTTIGFYSNADASSYWGFDLGIGSTKQLIYYIGGGCGGCPYGGVCSGSRCVLGVVGGSTSNNQWYNVKVHINNGDIDAKAWLLGVAEPVGWDLQISPGPAAIFGDHIMLGTEYGQDNEEFWFQAVTAHDIDLTIDVGPDGVIDWSNPSFIGTVVANFDTRDITSLISSSACANPVGDDCLLNLELFTNSSGEITLDNLEIRWMTIEGGLVPCDRMYDNMTTSWNEVAPCQLCHFVILAYNIINFLIKIVTLVAVLALVVGGLLYTKAAGDASLILSAKQNFNKILYGFVVIFIAWVIVNIAMVLFGFSDPLGNGSWAVFDCNVP